MIFKEEKVIIGVIHLPPLPGSPKYKGDFNNIIKRALKDAEKYVKEGVKYILIENFGDAPYRVRVKEFETIVAMTIISREIIKKFGEEVKVGINLLRNSGSEAMAIAYLTGGKFIRVNALCQTIDAPEGILHPAAREIAETMFKLKIKDNEIKILADVNVKHGQPITKRNIRQVIQDTIERGKAYAIILTGPKTGTPPKTSLVKQARKSKAKIFIGSGITPNNIKTYWKLADGFIIGSYFKTRGKTTNPVDSKRVKRLMHEYLKLIEKTNTP